MHLQPTEAHETTVHRFPPAHTTQTTYRQRIPYTRKQQVRIAATLLCGSTLGALQFVPPPNNPPLVVGCAWTIATLLAHWLALALLAERNVRRVHLVLLGSLLVMLGAGTCFGFAAPIASAHLTATCFVALLSCLALDASRSDDTTSSNGKYFAELLRPWKFSGYAIGMIVFVAGAYDLQLPTWDVGVSILMSAYCFLGAPWATAAVIEGYKERSWRRFMFGACAVYAIGSGSYEIYNTLRMGQHPPTYWPNLFFSVPVTLVAGLIWGFPGSLRDLGKNMRSVLRV